MTDGVASHRQSDMTTVSPRRSAPHGGQIPVGLYCLRGASGDWQPSVLCLLPNALSADIDFQAGSGVVTAAGLWRSDGSTVVVDDTVRDPNAGCRERQRLFDVQFAAERTTLIERSEATRFGRLLGALHEFAFVSDDLAIEAEVRPGHFQRRPVEDLIAEFHQSTRQATAPSPEASPHDAQAESPGTDQVRSVTQPDPVGPTTRSGTIDSPYANNAFRILGLPTITDARDVTRRAKELAILARLDGDEEKARRVRDAEAAIADPVRRVAEELLWVRGASGGISPDIDPTDRQAVDAARQHLLPLARQGVDDAIHDVAVVAHAAAVEDEGAPISDWQVGLTAWGSLLTREQFWSAERLRAALVGDPRLTASTIDILRAGLAWRILEPSARAVGRLVSQHRDADAVLRLTAMSESGLPPDMIAQARAQATAGLRSDLSQAQAAVTEAISEFGRTHDGRHLLAVADSSATDADAALRRISRLDPNGAEARIRADELAEALRVASVRMHNDGDDTAAAASIIDRATQIAASDAVRSRLSRDGRSLRRMDHQRRANEQAGRKDWDGAVRDLAAALNFADEPAERADIEQSLRVCRLNAAMGRAVRAAERRDWQSAIAGAEEARANVTEAQERGAIDAFIVRCRQASSQRNRRFLGWGIWAAIIVGVLAWNGITRSPSAPSRPAPVPTRQATPVGPTAPAVSLPTGSQIQPPSRAGGRSYLDVINGSSRDAVVKLVDIGGGAVLRFVYVKANDRVRLDGIEPGTYRVRFATGQDWDTTARRFRREPGFTEFRDPFDFRETRTAEGIRYTTGEITLNGVRGGNAPSNTIDESRF